MITFLLGFLVMLVAFLGLAAGIFLGRPPIRGSCGGLSQLGFQCSCKQPCANRQQRFARDLAAIDNRDVAIDDH